MLKRFLVISGVLSLLLAAIVLQIAQAQRRSFAADAGSIVFEVWTRDLEIYSVRPTGSAFGADLQHLFSSSQLDVMNPTFDGFDCAPDGRSLLIHHISLSRFDMTSRKLSIVPSEIAYTLGIAYAPNSDQVAFINVVAGGIFLINLDGTNLTRLTTSDNGFATSLSWSPDGSRIVYSANSQTNHHYTFSMSVVAVATGQITPIYTSSDNFDQVAWSPDGSRIAFEQIDSNGEIDLYTIQPDGAGFTRLTHSHTKTTSPRWSPDGTLISYSQLDLTGHFQVYVMNADGSDPYLVYAPPRGQDAFDLCWLKASA